MKKDRSKLIALTAVLLSACWMFFCWLAISGCNLGTSSQLGRTPSEKKTKDHRSAEAPPPSAPGQGRMATREIVDLAAKELAVLCALLDEKDPDKRRALEKQRDELVARRQTIYSREEEGP